MIYRLNSLSELADLPTERGSSRMVLTLTDSLDYRQLCGCRDSGPYTVCISRSLCREWKMAVCDFAGFCEAGGKDAVLVLPEEDWTSARQAYGGHMYCDPFLREDEPSVLIHSTPLENWRAIRRDGMLKCWNRLRRERPGWEEQPIGRELGDPPDFSDYVMLGGGVTGEIVVSSRQKKSIVMDENAEYLTGARLYFDAEKIAQAGLLVRDGCHLKVRDALPLEPYLLWAATWETAGLPGRTSTPKRFAEEADRQFYLAHPGCRRESTLQS